MSFTGTREGVFIVARVEFVNRFKVESSTVRTFVRMQAATDLKRDGWVVRDEHSYAIHPEPPAWCEAHKAFARAPHEWPTVDQLIAHLAHGGVWQVKTPADSCRVFTRVHNGVPEIRREDRSEWDVYGFVVPRREVTIEPEYRP